jgi:glycogen operon protein
MRKRFLKGVSDKGAAFPDVTWHGVKLNEPAWGDHNAQVLAFTLGAAEADEEDLHVILNMSEKELDMTLPNPQGKFWYSAVATAKPSPEDIVPRERQRAVLGNSYRAISRSVAVFERR